jgi:hypothetical protein
MECLFEATKNAATAIVGTMLQTQEHSLQMSRRLAEVALQAGEGWLNDQRALVTSTLAMLTSWQTYGLQMTRTIVDETNRPQQLLHQTNETLLEQTRRAGDAWQDLSMSWLRFLVAAFAAPPVWANGRIDDLEQRVQTQTRTRASSSS